MTEGANAEKAGQGETSGQSQNKNTPAGETPGGSNSEGFHPEAFNPQVAQELIEKLRESERTLNKELNAARRQVQTYEEQSQTDLETAQSGLQEAQATVQLQQQQIRDLSVRLQASALGVTDPKQQQAATALLDWEKLGEQPDDQAIEAELTKLVTDAPWLKSDSQTKQQPRVNPTNPQRQSNQSPATLADWIAGSIGQAKQGQGAAQE